MQTIHNSQGHVFTGWLARPDTWPLPQWSPVRDTGTEHAVIFPDGQAEHVAYAIRNLEPCEVFTWVRQDPVVKEEPAPFNSGDLLMVMFRDGAGS